MAKDEKNKKNKNVKEQKSSFFKDSKAELKRVSWPTPKALVNDTATVIGIVLVVAIIVVILDFIFLNVNENVIVKAEQNVRNKNNQAVTQVIDSIQNNDQTENNVEENNQVEGNNTEETTENAE